MEVAMDPSRRKRAEARRANVIYFLNRNGRIEHPHLIRVHHFCHSGVHLRDVKRWLSDLRGNEMPDSFTWSYQRRYKEGFVWQDLVDDDLITPISSYEYVLLGSLHPTASSSFPAEPAAANAESRSDSLPFPAAAVENSPEKRQKFVNDAVSTTPPPPDEGSLPREKVEDLGKSPAVVAGGRSSSWRASHVLWNFLACRAVETADNPHRVLAAGGCCDGEHGPHDQLSKTAEPTRPSLATTTWRSK